MSAIIHIVLNDEQRELLTPLLDIARERSGYEGILCTLARHYCPQAGDSVLELQVLEVPRSKLTKLLRLLSP